MRIWALQRPDLNRLQKTITTACEKKSLTNCPRAKPTHSSLSSSSFCLAKSVISARKKERFTSEKRILNVRPRESSAKNRREKNPQLPAKQGESRDVTFPRRTHVPISPPKARAKPFSLSSLLSVYKWNL
jgi:hypothetical protein